MTIDPLYLFVFAGLFSPGPNVIMLTASGARFGFAATLPHLAGVVMGVGVIAGVTGLGIGTLLIEAPKLQHLLKILSAVWILYMALNLWTTSTHKEADAQDKPFSFGRAVLFQWVNPKVWAIAISASSGYGLNLAPISNAARLASVFSGLNLTVCLFWAFSGSMLATVLQNPCISRLFYRFMAIALAGSAVLVFV